MEFHEIALGRGSILQSTARRYLTFSRLKFQHTGSQIRQIRLNTRSTGLDKRSWANSTTMLATWRVRVFNILILFWHMCSIMNRRPNAVLGRIYFMVTKDTQEGGPPGSGKGPSIPIGAI